MNSEVTNRSCNKFSILGEPEAVSPVGEKRRDESFQARAEEPTLFFGSSCNEERCVTTQRTAVEQTTLPLGLQASNFS